MPTDTPHLTVSDTALDTPALRDMLAGAGATATGVATAGGVDHSEMELYRRWLSAGRQGGMGYLEKYDDLRADPRLLLEGARSVVCAAFSYYRRAARGSGGLRWARYALGSDYHDEVRLRLGEVAERITAMTGAACRVCVDTAPLRERYWAVRSGVGFTGRNGLLIVPGEGSWCVLGFILTTLPLDPTEPANPDNPTGCAGCGRCVESCPGHALDGLGGMDARRCRSYLTIEYRGDTLPPLGDRVYGCDICQEVCPHNRAATETTIAPFAAREEVLRLTKGEIEGMTQEEFSRIFKGSAVKRTKLAGLVRNAGSTLIDPETGGDVTCGE